MLPTFVCEENEMITHISQKFLCFVTLAVSLMGAAPAQAQYTSDIDIYSGPAAVSDAPNVLIVLDNTANWSSAFTNEIAALVSTFNGLPVNRLNVGLMMFTETGSGDSNTDGRLCSFSCAFARYQLPNQAKKPAR